ncbi:ABC transporter substrate-binding protein [Tessaracoccus sp. OH4464_COT-324]|uniref:ABC transporter substrate-binding protein n=1 Tax=Tessaracoccus sp. OH4464_COT-324 TaxID=2491059 RepID=UPI000F644EAF|nr:ABC transporter substrate-binding protein [Tessaracoccus sp. OH4464_COT-324]RRD45951.1 carbohydrate ABC transporter substrate-binding protein [Tessaracoccus sp. OH4464_COT-324]
MKLSIKRLGALCAALGMTLGLVACGGETESGGEAAGQVVYWSMWQEDEPQAKVVQQAATDFEAKGSTKVKIEWQGRDVLTKVTPLLASGTDLPDLVDQSFDQLAPVLGRAGKATDLADVLAEKAEGGTATLKDAGLGNFVSVSTHDGKQIMLPYAANANVLWYDATAHPELETSAPDSLAKLNEYLMKRKAEDEAPVVIDGAYPYARLIWTMNVLRSHLGSSDRLAELAKDPTGAAWDAPEVLAAAEYIAKMHEQGLFPADSFGTKWPYQQEAFAQGKGTVIAMGSWLPKEVEKSLASGVKLKALPFPAKEAGKPSDVETSVFGFAIPTDAKNVAGAKAFAAFFLQPKYQQQLVADAGTLPVLSEVAGPEGQEALAKQLKQGHVAPVHGNIDALFPGWMQPIKDQTLALMTGEISAKQFVANAKQAQVTYWEQHG